MDDLGREDFLKYLALSLGLAVLDSNDAVVPLKLTLRPSPCPLALFAEMCDLQPHFNSLIDNMSRDVEFLRSALERLLNIDVFTRKLFEIHLQTLQEAPKAITIGIHRSDYMIDCDRVDGGKVDFSIKQIEMNTISVAFLAVSPAVSKFHKILYSKNGAVTPEISSSLEVVVEGFGEAFKHFGNDKACVLLVTLEGERNVFDQRLVEYQLLEKYQIECIHHTFHELSSLLRLGPNKELLVNDREVAIVYFRVGYSPSHYLSPDRSEWKVRLLLETSRAVCVPNIGYQLAGCKKIQQVLTEPGTLERFLHDKSIASRMRAVFAGLYTLDKTAEGDKAAEMGIKSPHKFVMKPQREGGGENLFGEDIKTTLLSLQNSIEREQFILMDKITPMSHKAQIYQNGSVLETEVVPEISCGGVFVRLLDKVILNKAAPYLVRTKPSSAEEAGVNLASGMLDSLQLLTTEQYCRELQCK